MIHLKSADEIARIAAAGHVVARVLDAIRDAVRPGVTTGDLDALAGKIIRESGAEPSFLGYGSPPYPACICVSVDDEVVHGIPGSRVLEEGSIVSIDVGAFLDGFHADAARTFAVGRIPAEAAHLVRITEEAFWKGFDMARTDCRMGDVSAAIQAHVEQAGYSVVRSLTGHGIGRALHEEPDVPNFGHAGRGLRLTGGLVFALEPMVNRGGHPVRISPDGWTVVTADGSLSAHYENTLAVLPDGPRILTA